LKSNKGVNGNVHKNKDGDCAKGKKTENKFIVWLNYDNIYFKTKWELSKKMIEQLKKHFGKAFVHSNATHPFEYEWFQTNEGEIFGILRQALSQKEKELLSSLFERKQSNFLPLTTEEQEWFRILFIDDFQHPQIELPKKFRFTQFLIKNQLHEKKEFTETIQSLFPFSIIILWENEHKGVIVEKDYFVGLRDLQYAAQAMISDFFIDLSFYVGTVQTCGDVNQLKQMFLFEKEAFEVSRKIHKRNVSTHYEIVPLMLLQDVMENELAVIMNSYLDSLEGDEEIIKTLKTYLESNMNVSHTAKKLYIHRNSVQYRIDKFIENTGVDIKNFQEAVTVYLLLNYKRLANSK
jgi:DNA-binding PucR family transcriptional regulator